MGLKDQERDVLKIYSAMYVYNSSLMWEDILSRYLDLIYIPLSSSFLDFLLI